MSPCLKLADLRTVFAYSKSPSPSYDSIAQSWCLGGTSQYPESQELCRRSAASKSANFIILWQIEQSNTRGLCYSIQQRGNSGGDKK